MVLRLDKGRTGSCTPAPCGLCACEDAVVLATAGGFAGGVSRQGATPRALNIYFVCIFLLPLIDDGK
jgi:hypothetical protein